MRIPFVAFVVWKIRRFVCWIEIFHRFCMIYIVKNVFFVIKKVFHIDIVYFYFVDMTRYIQQYFYSIDLFDVWDLSKYPLILMKYVLRIHITKTNTTLYFFIFDLQNHSFSSRDLLTFRSLFKLFSQIINETIHHTKITILNKNQNPIPCIKICGFRTHALSNKDSHNTRSNAIVLPVYRTGCSGTMHSRNGSGLINYSSDALITGQLIAAWTPDNTNDQHGTLSGLPMSGPTKRPIMTHWRPVV